MGGHEAGRLVKREKFHVDLREPYMGNTVPVEIIVTTWFNSGYYTTVRVVNPEGIWTDARCTDVQRLNKGD
jgi:hypothetical protein